VPSPPGEDGGEVSRTAPLATIEVVHRVMAVVLAVVVMTGCDATEESHADRADHSPRATTGASRVEVSEDELIGELKQARSRATTAVATFVATNAGPELISASGRVDFGTDPISFDLTIYHGQQAVHMVSVAGVGYVQDPRLGPTFAQLELDNPDNPFGALGGQLDPEDAYAEVSEGVEGIGAEDRQVGGEALHVYVVTVDPASLTALPDGLDGDDLPGTVEYQWSFDDRGQLRKVEADLGPEVAGFRYSFAKWGEIGGVGPPPEQLVVPAPSSAGSRA